MLRPALLLPPKRLSTPRSALRFSPPSWGPATGCSSTYPDGTSARWSGQAFRTHDRRSLRDIGAGNPGPAQVGR